MSQQFLLTALVTHEDKHTREAVVAWFNRAVRRYLEVDNGANGEPIGTPEFDAGAPKFSSGIVLSFSPSGDDAPGPTLDFHVNPYDRGIAVSAKYGDECLGESLLDYYDNKLEVKATVATSIGSSPDGAGVIPLFDDVRQHCYDIDEAKGPKVPTRTLLVLTDSDLVRIKALREQLDARAGMPDSGPLARGVLSSLLGILEEAGKRE